MGLFLTITVSESNFEDTKDAIFDYSGNLNSNYVNSSKENEIRKVKMQNLGTQRTALLHSSYDNDSFNLSRSISRLLDTYSITCSIYDGAFWQFSFFERGKELANFSSNPNYFETQKEIENCNYEIIAQKYQIATHQVASYLNEKGSNNFSDTEYYQEVYQFLQLLGLPAERIFSFEDYHSIFEQLNENVVSQITIENLRDTKKYCGKPFAITKDEATFLLGYDIDIDDIRQTHNDFFETDIKALNRTRYYLNVDNLTIQVHANRDENPESEIFAGYGFLNTMDRVHEFLNK